MSLAETPVSDFSARTNSVISEMPSHQSQMHASNVLSLQSAYLLKHDSIIARSPKIIHALDVAKRVAKSNANVLISGESGTGKEVLAKYIHSQSSNSSGPFVAINCSAIPEHLLESELFGHAKGSFTGAIEKHTGLFEEAENGTLFLDEIGDLTMALQSKLLRVLQERAIRRVGENQTRPINCRIISATHKNLANAVVLNLFREDLFFRLNVVPIMIPPLRERREDLLPLAEAFLQKFAAKNNFRASTLSKDAVEYLFENRWQGNVRELENAIERAVVLSNQNEISANDLMSSAFENAELNQPQEKVAAVPTSQFTLPFSGHLPSLDQVIHKYVEFAVSKNGGARDRTALEIGIDRKTLYKRLKSA